VDYFYVDRRLGNNADLKAVVRAFHDNGIMVTLDAVFNHTSRDFFAFKDIQHYKSASKYTEWYAGLDFSHNNCYQDGFSYEGWAGHMSLVKLNGNSREVREHLLAAVRFWIDEFDIDGLRLDAANVMSADFLHELSRCSKAHKPHFCLIGEMVGGDYRALAHDGGLDSVTNYELYKSLWSSFNDKNFYEIAWSLKRAFSPDPNFGLYRHIALYNFADNHDVDRVASSLKNQGSSLSPHLFPLYGILFCIPGIPSIYYGSEYGITGKRNNALGEQSDYALRPAWDDHWQEGEALFNAIKRFAHVRRESTALQYGAYRELFLSHEQFAFLRESEHECIIVAVNASGRKQDIFIPALNLKLPGYTWRDVLSGEDFNAQDAGMRLPLFPSWLRILRTTK
jgi:glycosidase